jgi:hypothetical protein
MSARTLLAAKHIIGHMSRSLSMKLLKEYPTFKNIMGLSEREILALVVHDILSKALRTEASRQLLIVRITSAGLTPPSSQPCRAWHVYRINIPHHKEVGVSVDGYASAPPSGASAAALPAGADLAIMIKYTSLACIYIFRIYLMLFTEFLLIRDSMR